MRPRVPRLPPLRPQEGDLLLAVDGTPVNTFSALERAVQRRPEASLTVLRDGRESTLSVRGSEVATDSTQHLVMWCGLILQQARRRQEASTRGKWCQSSGNVVAGREKQPRPSST